MFSMIHGYLPGTNYWEGLVKRGFIDNTSGLKLTQSVLTPMENHFNVAAAKGGKLWEIVKEAKRPFYVDRLQGGIFYGHYDFEQPLIAEYQELLGERFLGFQMHEWISNFQNDYYRIHQCIGKEGPWTAENIEACIRKEYPFEFVHLEAQTPEEWEQTPDISNFENMRDGWYRLYNKRKRVVDGMLLPVDGFHLAPRIEYELGAKNIAPEIGNQVPLTRVQVAVTRGSARAYNIGWGTYQEPWGGDPFSAYYYKRDEPGKLLNEWGIVGDGDFAFSATNENGGSSMALAKRIFFYSYLAGAQFLSEEWGVANTFYDWEDFELSPYGIVKKDFLDFVSRTPHRGTPYTPFAIVLPKEMEVFNISTLANPQRADLTHGESEAVRQLSFSVIRHIFGTPQRRFDSWEANSMINSEFGDLFDIVYEDQEGLFDRYSYLIDTTPSQRFRTAHSKKERQILSPLSLDTLDHTLDSLMKELLPFTVEGTIHWTLNKVEDGWLVGFFNNEGVIRKGAFGEYTIREADAPVRLNLQSSPTLRVLEGAIRPIIDQNAVSFTVPAGQLAVIHLRI